MQSGPANTRFSAPFWIVDSRHHLASLRAKQVVSLCVKLQVEPGKIWCFEQEQSLAGLNVTTTIRMTVIKLQNGDLLVYAPIAPTR